MHCRPCFKAPSRRRRRRAGARGGVEVVEVEEARFAATDDGRTAPQLAPAPPGANSTPLTTC